MAAHGDGMTANSPARPRRNPCGSCPFRRDVASGIWDESEYAKLARYDGDMIAQAAAGAVAVFRCHLEQGDREVCAGWLGHRDPTDLLAVRMGISSGDLDVSCATYSTSAELHPSGAEAAAHGMRDITNPTDAARAAIEKIIRGRSLPGKEPLTSP